MTSSHHTRPPAPPIVVGVDGSGTAAPAVRWAAREAGRRRLPLRLVHAVAVPRLRHATAVADERRWAAALRAEGKRVLDEAVSAARAAEPRAVVSSVLGTGHPVLALVEEARDARVVVLGARTGGSVAVGVAGRARGPVVVVRGDGDEVGRVVVGVDGSPVTEAAVGFAFEQASLRGARLRAVHAWAGDVYFTNWSTERHSFDWQTVPEDELLTLLDERMSAWQEKYPDVRVERVVMRKRPAPALLDHAADAQLLVLGSDGALVGATGRAVLDRATCPVAVVR